MAIWVAGVDLGKKGAHVAVLADESGQQIGPALSFFTSPDDLDRVRAEFKARAPEGTEFVFVMEPTPTWRPVARYLKACGHRAFLANQSQAKSLRNLLKRHAKTDRLDALALAKLPLVSPRAVHAAPVPDDPRWEVLLRGVKREYKLSLLIANLLKWIKEDAEQCIPGVADLFPEPERPLDNLVYRDYCTLERHRGMTCERLREEVQARLERPPDPQEARRIDELFSLAQQALRLHGKLAPATAAAAEAIREDLEFLRLLKAEQKRVTESNYELYRELDKKGCVRSLRGVGPILAPVLLAVAPVAAGMTSGKQMRKFSGYVPRVDNSGLKEGKGQSMTKAGPAWFKRALFLASDAGRKCDPQLARIYRRAMVEKGFPHVKAVCEVAAHMADRLFRVLKDNRLYELRDAEGNPVSAREARQIIATRYTVPEEVRARLRRQKKHETGSSDERDGAKQHLPAMQAPSGPQVSTDVAPRSTGTGQAGQAQRVPAILAEHLGPEFLAHLAARQPDSLALSVEPRRDDLSLRAKAASRGRTTTTAGAPSQVGIGQQQSPTQGAENVPQPHAAAASRPPAVPVATAGVTPGNGHRQGTRPPLEGSATTPIESRPNQAPAVGADAATSETDLPPAISHQQASEQPPEQPVAAPDVPAESTTAPEGAPHGTSAPGSPGDAPESPGACGQHPFLPSPGKPVASATRASLLDPVTPYPEARSMHLAPSPSRNAAETAATPPPVGAALTEPDPTGNGLHPRDRPIPGYPQ